MSNTITHLTVANKIIKNCPALVSNIGAFYLGSVAPDTIGSMRGCTREDKKRVHLRSDIRDAQWLNDDKMQIFNERILEFAEVHINNAEGSQRDFNIGYLVHLLTDKWNHKTIRQTMLKIANENNILESDKEFFYMMINDLEALDNYLLNEDDEVRKIFKQILDDEVIHYLKGYIDKEYIEDSIQWWKNSYLPNISKKQLKYITENDIIQFVNIAVEQIVKELKMMSEERVLYVDI